MLVDKKSYRTPMKAQEAQPERISVILQPDLKYTKDGIKRLAATIQATLIRNQWSGRKLSQEAGLAPSTVNRYMNGHLSKPQEEVIKALAPYIYKVTAIDNDSVEIDPNQVYNNWIELAKIATDEFIPEHESLNKFMSIVSKIKECMRRQNISQVEIENRLIEMQDNKTARMSLSRLREIQEQPTSITDDELRIIRNLVDPYEKFFSEADWLRSAFPEIFLSQKSLAQPSEQGISENELSKNGSH